MRILSKTSLKADRNLQETTIPSSTKFNVFDYRQVSCSESQITVIEIRLVLGLH